MALKKIVPTSPSKNLLKEVDMTPLKVGDWNNDLKGQVTTELATKADSASPTFYRNSYIISSNRLNTNS